MPDPDEQRADVGSAEEREGGRATAKGSAEVVELSRQRLSFARRIAESRATIPHLEMSVSFRLERSAGAAGEPDPWTPLEARVVRASGSALAEFPDLNASRRDTSIERHSRANVGVCSRGPEAPAFPTIFDAGDKSAAEIGAELADLRTQLSGGTITSPKLSGGTFSVTFVAGPERISPVVLTGQSAALGVAVRSDSDGPVLGSLTLAVDHRLVLHQDAADFLSRTASLLADPDA